MTQSQQGKRSALGGLLALAVTVSVLAWVGKWVADPAVTPLRVAKIEGELRYLKRADLERAVADVSRGGFFTVDVRAVQRAAESLPWVAKASVRRTWPDSLHILVVEQTPFARWGEKGLVNPRGEVFVPGELDMSLDLPYLAGPEGSGQEVVERYRYAGRVLESLGMKVARIELSERRAWSLRTDGGVIVQLGVGDFQKRLERFVKAYPLLTKERDQKMESADMRYSNGMAVKWAERVEERVSINWGQFTVSNFS